jgi:hypothetical protein
MSHLKASVARIQRAFRCFVVGVGIRIRAVALEEIVVLNARRWARRGRVVRTCATVRTVLGGPIKVGIARALATDGCARAIERALERVRADGSEVHSC